MAEVRRQKAGLKTVRLYNFWEHIPLPADRNQWIQNQTISISALHATHEVVLFCHAHNTQVCVWVDTDGLIHEGEDHYRRMIELGVDYICTDFPLEAKAFIRQEALKRAVTQ